MVISADLQGDVSAFSAQDVYNDYLDRQRHVPWDPSKRKWKLLHNATPAQYKLWEQTMESGFCWCNLKHDDPLAYTLATMRVDGQIYLWWGIETRARGIPRTASWEDYRKFLRLKFMAQSETEDKVVIPEGVEPLSGLNM